jgi:hypothetical protein
MKGIGTMNYRDEEEQRIAEHLNKGGAVLLKGERNGNRWMAQITRFIEPDGEIGIQFAISDLIFGEKSTRAYPAQDLDVFFDDMWSICDLDEWELIE